MKLKNLWMLAIASLLGLSLVGCGSNSKLELKKETFVVEFGETISMDAKTYLVKDTDKDVLKDAQVLIKLNKMTPTPIGTYDATIKFKDESVKFKVKVKDTKKPEFVDFKDKIEIEQGFNGDITTMFKASDLSEVKITVDTKNTDFNKAGEYKVNVIATDESKNKTTKEVIIIVKEKKQSDINEESSVTESKPNNSTAMGGTNSGVSTNTPPQQVKPTPPVCQAGTPSPKEIGNSGLLFYGNESYYSWFDQMSADNGKKFIETYGYTGWDGWTINFDTCGNPMETVVWTVNFK